MTRNLGIAAIALTIFACRADDDGGPRVVDVPKTDGSTSSDADVDPTPDAPASDPTFCTHSRECGVRPIDCCQPDCGENAIAASNGAGYRDFVKSCFDRGCTACRVSARWVPRCVNGRCAVIDLEASPQSACLADEDCELRWGTGCCPKCQPEPVLDLVSVSWSASFCEPGDGCDPCTSPPLPTAARAVCVNDHCKVQKP